MSIPRTLGIIAGSLLAFTTLAQSSGEPLNLKLPPGSLMPAPASSAHAPATAKATAASTAGASTGAAPASASTAPGVYYGDTSGRTYADTADTTQSCDDSTYNQPQVHGSVGMGVVGGNHVSGNYQTGTINISKALGSCDHPTGGVGISIRVGKGDFHDRRWGH